jgi:serine/threonine protein kinase
MNQAARAQPAMPEKIGRFELVRILGKGAQGTVYLARDPHLQRQVAIKTLHVGESENRERSIKALLDEARIVSKFQHPNIVTVYDAGEHEGSPYLVFEYVEGTTLAALLKKQTRLPVARAGEIAVQILDGIAYAHQKQIAHRDLKPANIMIDSNGTARIMDFGIARSLSQEKATTAELFGTPFYMAPEYISQGVFDPKSDIFSVGMMLYEMLTGAPAVQGKSAQEVLDRIVNQVFAPPSAKNGEISEQLDGIVQKALAKNPLDRFEQAGAMRHALQNYLEPEAETEEKLPADAAQSTVEFLLRRMRHKSDFPALSKTISDINNIVSSEQDGADTLSRVILKDFALTNKLLKIVNTAVYAQFGNTVSTISRAVVILGFEAIRNAAITLLLFEHLQNKAQANHLKDEAIAAFFNGIIGKEIALKSGVRDAEEAMICAMFHNLGKLLATFYFYEETLEINKRMQQKGVTETQASQEVLGVSYEELGIGIASAWNFPSRIVHSLRKVTEDRVRKPNNDADKLRVISSLSSELSRIAANTPVEDRSKELKRLVARYGGALSMSEQSLGSVMEHSLREIASHAAILNINMPQSAFIKKVTQWSGSADTAVLETAGADGDTAVLDDTLLKTSPLGELRDDAASAAATPDAGGILAAGIQDITNSLVSDFTLNDVLRMILEAMYRGMGFTRVLLCVRNAPTNTMNGRFGYGPDIDAIAKVFKFPLSYAPDVFHVALSKGVDVMISDINAENIADKVPAWYRKSVPAQSFVIFPIMLNKAPIAMIYADMDHASMSLPAKELNLLKTLRNQAVLAIKQKS